MSGCRPQRSAANISPVRPKPVLTSSRHSSQSYSRHSSVSAGQNVSGGRSTPPGPGDRLDHDAGDLVRVHRVEQQLVADEVDGRVAGAAGARRAERRAVRVRVRRVQEPGRRACAARR